MHKLKYFSKIFLAANFTSLAFANEPTPVVEPAPIAEPTAESVVTAPDAAAAAPVITTESVETTASVIPTTDAANVDPANKKPPRKKYPMSTELFVLGGTASIAADGGDGRKLDSGFGPVYSVMAKNIWRRIQSDLYISIHHTNFVSTVTEQAINPLRIQWGWSPGYSYPVFAFSKQEFELHVKSPLEKTHFDFSEQRTDFTEHLALLSLNPSLGVEWRNPWVNTAILGGYWGYPSIFLLFNFNQSYPRMMADIL